MGKVYGGGVQFGIRSGGVGITGSAEVYGFGLLV